MIINKDNNFNLLRLLAALQVVFIHSVTHLQITNSVVIFLRDTLVYFPGVPIFFLISGYLITMSYEKNKNIYEYAKNRLLRIIPGLYVSFFIGFIIIWYFNQFKDVYIIDILLWCFAQLTIVQFYNPDFIRDFGVGVLNGSLWTITVEMSFYIILPFLYAFLQKNFYKRFIFLLIASFLFYYYISNVSTNTFIYEKLIKVSILPYLFYFLFGLFSYKYIHVFQKYLMDKVLIYLLVYISVIFFSIDSFIFLIFKQFILSLFVFSFVFSYRTLSYKIMKHNDFTYGIYIYHMLIINIFVQLGYIGEINNIVLIFIFSIICGVFSYFIVEKPFLNMKRKSLYNEINK